MHDPTQPPPTESRERIAILGAGPAGLSAALALSGTEGLRERYEITIYQVGWRAGGKCATGREPPTQRILQNGSHYIFGCYANALRLLRRTYEELNERGDASFGTFEEALHPASFIVAQQRFAGETDNWHIQLPTNSQAPGEGGVWLPLWCYTEMILKFTFQAVFGWKALRWLDGTISAFPQRHPRVSKVLGSLVGAWAQIYQAFGVVGLQVLWGGLRLVCGGRDRALRVLAAKFRFWRGFWRFLLVRFVDRSLWARRLWIMADLSTSMGDGMIRDGVFGSTGFDGLDQWDFREWLDRCGASEVARDSPVVWTWYNSVAAFERGDPRYPNIAAGATVRGLIRAGLDYQGAFTYQLAHEVGDSVIAPICVLLRHRGVRFEYFHRVTSLETDEETCEIRRVHMERQVELADGAEEYDPFVHVEGQKVWPWKPRYDRIASRGGTHRNPESIEEYDLESFYTRWKGEPHPIELGKDYDRVVFALPGETAPYVCSELLAARSSWREMTRNLKGVETQSLRLWFKDDLAGLGWPYPHPILSNHAQPFTTWEDNSHLMTGEEWPAGNVPHAISSVFGSLIAPELAPGPEDHDYPVKQQEQARSNALHFLRTQVGTLWPNATRKDDPGHIEWRKLVALGNVEGEERFDFQRVVANSGPLNRYTLTQAGGNQHRLAPDEAGYRNLYLAGDWTRNGIYVGSVEGAVVSGLLAARAISGHPVDIVNEPFA
jgi:uncharacterized protein with NAD-binding domain and iron-sulfur cluster